MPEFSLAEHPHRRYNPLTKQWILVSPHRTKRPWLGQVETAPVERRPTYDPMCYLCPGNERAGGVRNPPYRGTFVFDNDFAALLPGVPAGEYRHGDLLWARAEPGLCRVVCFSPDHSLTLAAMEIGDVRRVVDVWTEQYAEIGARPEIGYVQIFENKGAIMGSSNPHPHGQIWASASVPQEPAVEGAAQAEYLARHGRCLLCDYLAVEADARERIICENEGFVALVPFWATWPFEAMILGRRHAASLLDLTDDERTALADILKRLTTRYDNLFQVSFPYTMGIHQQPTDGAPYPAWHLHLHAYPPLLRSATVKKFMVGYEMLANPQRDLTPEAAAARLAALSEERQV
ncbi:MAG TPA: UDP-glucose--hexose-1-phosphate uridylyltransferase [Chloroflexi bacterium]|jgi:UDPglucose--hexose-1-phosphate uridylyltransferase|nr:UDP-glucose--hexose-1-phosphate uridylyltransferase [Chloroflexota bacterium]